MCLMLLLDRLFAEVFEILKVIFRLLGRRCLTKGQLIDEKTVVVVLFFSEEHFIVHHLITRLPTVMVPARVICDLARLATQLGRLVLVLQGILSLYRA